MPRRRPFHPVHLLLAAAVMVMGAGPARAAEAGSQEGGSHEAIRCYPARGPTGILQRFCESETIVTVEPLTAGAGAIPSPATARLHEDAQPARIPFWSTEASGSLDGRSRWAGISVIANGIGGVRQGDRGAPRFGMGLRVDSAPLATIPVFVGAEIGYEHSPPGASDLRFESRRPSGFYAEMRAGWAIDDVLAIYGTMGLHQRRPHGAWSGGTAWSVGAGVSYALDAAWALTIDYRFTRMPNGRASPVLGAPRIHDDASLVLGGITYRFLEL